MLQCTLIFKSHQAKEWREIAIVKCILPKTIEGYKYHKFKSVAISSDLNPSIKID